MPVRKRLRLMAIALGLTIGALPTAVPAAEQVVFVSGAFRRSIPVADFEHLATTGEARGLLGDVLRLGRQDPQQVSRLLSQSVSLPVTLVSRLLHTRIGDALLDRLSRIVYPLNTPEVGVPALRSALVLGIEQGDGSLSPVSFLQAYPNDHMEVNLPALMALLKKANSITDLVRFFTESPLDGLRGEGTNGGT